MEAIQFYSGIIFLSLAAFLFLEERNFKKNLIKIKGRVVGYSKGKSKTNKRYLYPIIEFLHPSGERGWVEAHKLLRAPMHSLGAEVPLVVDKDDFHITRTSSSLSYLWAGVFTVLALANLFSFMFSSIAGWELGVLTLAFVVVVVFFAKDAWREQDEDFKAVSAWRAWRLQIVKSRVYNEAEVENIQFWDKESCLKFFKGVNRHRIINLVFASIYVGAFLLWALKTYVETEQFYSTSHKSTATIVKIASSGTPVFEYYDIEGVAHRALVRGGVSSEKIKVGDRFNVLYTSNNYREIRHDYKGFMYFETVMMIAFAIYIFAIFAYSHRRMSKLNLNAPVITSAEELIMKKAG